MEQITETLRMHYQACLSPAAIASKLGVPQQRVKDFISRASAQGVSWPPPKDWDEGRLEQALYPEDFGSLRAEAKPTKPDFAYVHNELLRSRTRTMQQLWEEYQGSNPGGYCYSQFGRMYRAWKFEQRPVVAQWALQHQLG